jgi:hypothetical protein
MDSVRSGRIARSIISFLRDRGRDPAHRHARRYAWIDPIRDHSPIGRFTKAAVFKPVVRMRGGRAVVRIGRTVLRIDLIGTRPVPTRTPRKHVLRSMRRRQPNILRRILGPRSIRRRSVKRLMDVRRHRRAGLLRVAVRNRNGMKNSRVQHRARKSLLSSSLLSRSAAERQPSLR